jgi:uncharacterized protein YndB with AHSA1/START domain
MDQSKIKTKEVFITHLFDALPAVVFEAWTNSEQLAGWYAPDGCSIYFKSIDVREGGSFHSCIHDPVHGDCWIKGIYKEVVFPERLVFSMALSNAEGLLIRSAEAGKSNDWPEETVTTVTFSQIGSQTKLTLHQTVSEEEAKKTGAYQSWISMFDRLNSLLASRS